MKYYSGLEKLHLSGQKVEGGYRINGILPAVSNLGNRHYFGAIAAIDDTEVMVLVSTQTEGLTLKEKVGFIGVNGSATYTCNSMMYLFRKSKFFLNQRVLSVMEFVRRLFTIKYH